MWHVSFRVRLPGFESCLYHLLAICNLDTVTSFLRASVSYRITKVAISWGDGEDPVRSCEQVLRTVPSCGEHSINIKFLLPPVPLNVPEVL